MQFTIDRFEGDFAVIEFTNNKGDLLFTEISKDLVPEAKEGDVFDIIINRTEIKKREENIKNLMNNLFE